MISSIEEYKKKLIDFYDALFKGQKEKINLINSELVEYELRINPDGKSIEGADYICDHKNKKIVFT